MQRRVLVYARRDRRIGGGDRRIAPPWRELVPGHGVERRSVTRLPHRQRTAADALRRPLALLIIQLLVIVLATQTVGSLASLFRQPTVVGEIAAGLLLGPSLVGQLLAGRLHVPLSGVVARHPAAAEPGRRHPLHVQRRTRCRCGAPPSARADGHRRQPLQHRRSVPARRRDRAGALPAARPTGRAVSFVRALHGHRAEHHGVSGARARPRGARADSDAARDDRPRLRRRRTT